jgi:hypothetical protein
MTREQILELEFNYIAETAHQAIADRYRIVSFYIALASAAGGLIATLLTANSEPTRTVLVAIAVICLSLSAVGWLFVIALVRLRQRWYGSMVSLNAIKEYYVTMFPDLQFALQWRAGTLPQPQQMGNIHFFMTLFVIILNSLLFTLALGIYLHPITRSLQIGMLGTVAGMIVLIQILLSYAALRFKW